MLGHFDFIDEASDEISNSAYIATHTRIILKLKLLDELAFSTLRPVSHLHPFVEGLLATSGIAWINGLTGSGKTFVARRIGKNKDLTKNTEKKITCILHIIFTYVHTGLADEISQSSFFHFKAF